MDPVHPGSDDGLPVYVNTQDGAVDGDYLTPIPSTVFTPYSPHTDPVHMDSDNSVFKNGSDLPTQRSPQGSPRYVDARHHPVAPPFIPLADQDKQVDKESEYSELVDETMDNNKGRPLPDPDKNINTRHVFHDDTGHVSHDTRQASHDTRQASHKPGCRRTVAILAVIVVLLLLVIAGGGGYFGWRLSHKSGQYNCQTPTDQTGKSWSLLYKQAPNLLI